ncbi:diguanylate cyclase domain-containing protein [Candidatus Magnetominusculus dajiuhuensis]|uniref:diguanylate cyclase domain-containing protein n=1 Tax=Candidatus Magnetominusculus dajiuhuensis TaxID=3137712 RepID=UPI003B438E5A
MDFFKTYVGRMLYRDEYVILKRYWVFPILIWAALVACSLVWNLSSVKQQSLGIMEGQARSVFELIEVVRLWNMRHGGVYVPIAEATPSNPYLDVPGGQTVSIGDKKFTYISPYYMTRQLSALAKEHEKGLFHATSLKPINSANAPDEWESTALKGFEKTKNRETFELIEKKSGSSFRYMSALLVDESCLMCHAIQGYKVGDIRGGISVTINADTIVKSTHNQWINLSASHGAAFFLVSGLMLFSLSQRRNQYLSLQKINSRMNDDMIVLQQMSDEMRESEERFRLIAESVSDVIWTLDASMDSFTYVSPSIASLRGFTVEEAVNETFAEAMTPQSYAYVRDILMEKLACFKDSGNIDCFSERIELEQKCKDGRIIPVEVVLSAIIGADGQIKEFVGISRDITQRKKEEEKLKYRSTHDSMTGLYNRAYFDAELERVAKGRQFPVSFIVADLDGLKRVNDSIGHEAGDRLIRGASDVLKMAFRGSDVVARTGGDEFIVILSETDEGLSVRSIDRVRAYQSEYNKNNNGRPVSISLGAATAYCALDIELAIKDADKRMYEDKVSRKQQRVG